MRWEQIRGVGSAATEACGVSMPEGLCAVLASRRMLWSHRRATGNHQRSGAHSESWDASVSIGEGSGEIGLNLEKPKGVN